MHRSRSDTATLGPEIPGIAAGEHGHFVVLLDGVVVAVAGSMRDALSEASALRRELTARGCDAPLEVEAG
jgi:hypothetical protein